jgi:hypothetical protein
MELEPGDMLPLAMFKPTPNAKQQPLMVCSTSRHYTGREKFAVGQCVGDKFYYVVNVADGVYDPSTNKTKGPVAGAIDEDELVRFEGFQPSKHVRAGRMVGLRFLDYCDEDEDEVEHADEGGVYNVYFASDEVFGVYSPDSLYVVCQRGHRFCESHMWQTT